MPDLTTEALELELTEMAEAPDPDFERELAALVRAGFPRKRRFKLPELRRPPLPVMAAAASIIAAIAVAVPLLNNDDDAVQSLKGDAPAQKNAAPQALGGEALSDESAPSTTLPAPVPPEDGRSGFNPSARERRIERSARLTLAAPGDDLDDVASDIGTVTERYRGFILSSSIDSGEDSTSGGQFELRIPADKLQPALADLSKLGDVTSRSQQGQDVTAGYVTAQDRLEAARAERRSLRRRLENAENDTQAEVLRTRLDANAREISSLRMQLRDLRLRTNYAAVSVTLRDSDESGIAPVSDGNDDLGGALDDAVESLSDAAEAGIRVLGVLVPIALLAGLAAMGIRAFRRRRRESALS